MSLRSVPTLLLLGFQVSVGCGGNESETAEVAAGETVAGPTVVAEQTDVEPGVPQNHRLASGQDAAAIDLSGAGEPLREAVARFQRAELAQRRGDLEEAVREGDLAVEQIAGLGRPRLEVDWLNRIGLIDRQRGRLEIARRRFEEGLQRARAAADRAGEASSLHNLGLLAQDRADLPRAMASYRRALELWRGLDRPIDHARTLSRLASVHSLRSQLVEARDLLAEALEILPLDERAQRSDVLVQIGWTHFLSKDPEAALASYRRALDLLDDSTPILDRAGLLDRMGTAERQRGRFDQARRLYDEALRVLAGSESPWEAHIRGNLGELYLEWGRLEEARSQLEKAATSFRRSTNDNALAHMLTSLAEVERCRGRLEQALGLLQEAVELSDGLWRKAFEQGDLARPTALVQDIDALYVDLLMELDSRIPGGRYARRAFERSDLARDRNLLTLVGVSPAPEGVETAAWRARESELESEIEALEVRRNLRRPDAELDRELRLKLLALEEVRRAVRARTLADGALPPPLDLDRLRAALSDGVCILSYVLGMARSHLFVLCPEGLESHPLPPRELLESQAQALVEALSISDQQRARGQAAVALQAMAEALLGPVEDRLRRLHRIVVAPEGALTYVPFAALPGSSGPLLAELQVVQGPSIGVLAALAARAAAREERTRRIVILADPVYSPWDPRCTDCRSPTSATADAGVRPPSWMRLPGTGAEGQAIRDLAPAESQLHLGFEANRRAVLGGALRGASIVHIAAHGHLDDRVPSSSGIVLSQFDAAGRPEEGTLHIRDIRTLELEADLVVLSACHSAWGQAIRGDGLLGMAQAFFVAGASRLLVSLWAVDDRATAALMTELYRQLLVDRATPAEALRRAQSKIRSETGWEAPFYWAGFVLLDGWR